MDNILIAFCDTYCDNSEFTREYSNTDIDSIASDICDDIPVNDRVEASIETEDGELVAYISGNCKWYHIDCLKEYE